MDEQKRAWGNVRPERITLNRASTKTKSTMPIWLQVAIGILLAGVIGWGVRVAFVTWQLKQFTEQMQEQTRKAQERSAEIQAQAARQAEINRVQREQQQRIQADQRARQEAAATQQRINTALWTAEQKKAQTDSCRFWTAQLREHGGERAREKAFSACNLSATERQIVLQQFYR